MRSTLPVLLLVICVGGGTAFWALRGRSTGASSSVEQGAPATSPEGPHPVLKVEENALTPLEGRQALAPPAEETLPAEPGQTPPKGALPGAAVSAVFGGAEAIAAFHIRTSHERRKARLVELEQGLAEYPSDPPDPGEFEKYKALKLEADWLRTNPGN